MWTVPVIIRARSDASRTAELLPLEYHGREVAVRFLQTVSLRPGRSFRLVPTRANGQPAFGFYVRDPETGGWYTVGLMVLSLSGSQISALTRFDSGTLPRFGLPVTLTG